MAASNFTRLHWSRAKVFSYLTETPINRTWYSDAIINNQPSRDCSQIPGEILIANNSVIAMHNGYECGNLKTEVNGRLVFTKLYTYSVVRWLNETGVLFCDSYDGIPNDSSNVILIN